MHLQHAGSGEKVLEYLARYVFRIALVNSRLERFENGQVTFRFRDGRSGKTKHCTLEASAFIARFLQHVLPQGFSKVRHYGLFSPARKTLLDRARNQLIASNAIGQVTDAHAPHGIVPDARAPEPNTRCPFCGNGVMRVIAHLPRSRPPP